SAQLAARLATIPAAKMTPRKGSDTPAPSRLGTEGPPKDDGGACGHRQRANLGHDRLPSRGTPTRLPGSPARSLSAPTVGPDTKSSCPALQSSRDRDVTATTVHPWMP